MQNFICMYAELHMYVCMQACLYFIRMGACMYVRMCIYTCVCVYIHVCVYTYMYTHIHTLSHSQAGLCPRIDAQRAGRAAGVLALVQVCVCVFVCMCVIVI
jgi:hypothetical protein